MLTILGVTPVPDWIAWFAGVLGVVGLVASSVAVSRQTALRASMTAFVDANNELRRIVEDQRRELAEERAARVAIEARLELFQGQFAEHLVEAVVRTARTLAATPPTPPAH